MASHAHFNFPSLPTPPERGPGLAELALAIVAFGVALLAIWRLVPLYGISVSALLTVPLAVIAWNFGLKGALLGSVFALPAGIFMCVRIYLGPARAEEAGGRMLLAIVSAHLGVLLIACVTGRLRDLSVRIARELEEHAREVRLLRHSEARNQALLGALPDLIFRLDSDARVSGASGARGHASSSMRSATYLDQLIPAEAAALMRERAREVRESGIAAELEYGVSEQDDGRDYEARLMKCEGDRVLVIIRNVTRQKRLERELIAAKEAALDAARSKTKFLANMSHEIRTPMNGVIGMTTLLLETPLGQEQREYALIIQKSGQALLAIIDDILDFAKIEAGRLELDRIAFDLRACAEESVAAVSGQAYAKDLDLGCLFARDVPRMVTGDPTRLRQVLANLLGNAVKYTERGYVLLSVTRIAGCDGMLRFSVCDSGPGVSAELVPRLFRPLLLGEAGAGAVRDGTGLGLAIARELVQLMDGEIRYESHPGEGSEFSFTAQLDVSATSDDDREPDLTGTRVLIARDPEAPRRLLDRQLEGLGIEARRVSEGALVGALRSARAAERPFLAVILESGRELPLEERIVSGLRSDGVEPVPIVLVSPGEARSGADEALRRRATRVLDWPLSRAELVNCLSALLGRSEPAAVTATAPTKLSARVLVAEDNMINQRVAQRTLELIGCESVVVDDGQKAVEATLANRFDVVLMDCQMPVMDGFEATREIRAREVGRRTPIVAMTAGGADAERERWREVQMDAYITKPVSVEQLRDTIAKLVAASPEAPRDEGRKGVADEVLDRSVLDELRLLGDAAFMSELVRLFIEQAPRNLEVARAALSVGDLDAAAKAAHTIKSSAGYLGARRLAQLCVRLEQRAHAGETLEVGRALEDLAAEYDVVRLALLAEVAEEDEPT